MPAEITMPQLSDTMTEGTLVKWHKKEGDKVKSGDIVADVETDKAVMEMESSDNGTLAAILVAEGQKVPVGGLLALVATGKEDPAEVKKSAASRKSEPAPATASATAVAHAEKSESAPASRSATAIAEAPPPQSEGNGQGRLRVSPLARRIANDKQVDLQSITGTGPGGRIVKQDVLNYVPSPSIQAELPQRIGSGQKETLPLTKMRAAIAKQLQISKQTIPHFYETIDADIEELSGLRARINQSLEKENIRLSLSDFIAKSVTEALLRHPVVNSTFNGTEVTRYGDVNLGMAVSIPDGLIVPVLRNIHLMGLKEIRQRSADLIERARAQRLRKDEMTGGTFTISSLGTYGVREFSAIINPPQVAILAVGAAEKRAVFRDGQIVGRTMLTLTMSSDHRVVDGATAADFLRTLKQFLEEPWLMLT